MVQAQAGSTRGYRIPGWNPLIAQENFRVWHKTAQSYYNGGGRHNEIDKSRISFKPAGTDTIGT